MPGSHVPATGFNLVSALRLAPLVCAWALIVLVPDLVVRERILGPLDGGRSLLLGLGYAVSLALWVCLALALGRARRRRSWSFWVIVLPFVLLVPSSVLAVERYSLLMHAEIPASASAFVLGNPWYALSLAAGAMGAAAPGVLLLVQAAVLAAFAFAARRPLEAPAWSGRTSAALALPLVMLPGAPLPPDLHGARALVGGVWLRATEVSRLPPETHRPPLAASARRAPHVVLLLQESLSAERWSPWNARDGAADLSGFLERYGERAVWFPGATSASGCTDVSVPSLLTGLDPDATRDAYARAPLLWQEARAAGARTALFSAQNYAWAGFEQFFLGADRPDEVKTAADYPRAGRVCDGGVDDRLVVDDAIARIEAQARDGGAPMFLVVHFNATHFPCWTPAEPRIDDPAERCRGAAAFVAQQTARVLGALERTGLLDDTLVVGTADHGEHGQHGRPGRLENYDEQTLRVPMFLVLPAALARDEPGLLASAQANRGSHVGNVDLFPTVLDAWGRWPASGERPALAGASLLRPLPAGRLLVVSNTNDIRSWSRDGYALYRGRWKWRIDEREGAQLFDLGSDPGEEVDRAAEAPEEQVAWLREQIGLRPHLRRAARKGAPWLGW